MTIEQHKKIIAHWAFPFFVLTPLWKVPMFEQKFMELHMDDTHTENKNLWMTSMIFSVFHGKTY